MTPTMTGPVGDDQARGASHRPRWWVQVVVVFVAYQLYRLARIRLTGPRSLAEAHANQVIRVERALGIFRESALQRAFLHHTRLLQACDIYYGSIHFIAPVAVLVVLWRRAPERYTRWRNVFAAMLVLGLVGFAVYPLLPPHLLPPGMHFVRTAAAGGPLGSGSASGESSVANNPYAAMPSLHMGWATWCSLAVLPLVRRPLARVVIALYPLATLFVVVVTANHYFLDAVGGWLTLALAYGAERGRSAVASRPLRR